MDNYNPKKDKDRKLAASNSLDGLKQAIADYYYRDSADSIIVNPDGCVSARNKNGSISQLSTQVKQVVRKQTVTGYVFLLK